MEKIIKRVCAAIIKDNNILMVFHQHDNRSYWTLPGGGVDHGETPEQAVIREVLEETGLHSTISKFLFDEPFNNDICRCFLMSIDESQKEKLGYDPEEAHLDIENRMLKNISWHSLENMCNDFQVSKVLHLL